MGFKGMLTGKWFTRIVLVSWIICAASILVVFKNMEFIVHGQLYDFGLVFSPEWADGYRILTWMIFLCTGVPIALSGIALASSFLKVEKIPESETVVPKKVGPPRGVTKVGPPKARPSQPTRPVQQARQVQQPVREPVKRVDSNLVGISCPECKKVFHKALVMLDFRGGSNRMVSVCPYCNNVLGYTSEEKCQDQGFSVASNDERITQ